MFECLNFAKEWPPTRPCRPQAGHGDIFSLLAARLHAVPDLHQAWAAHVAGQPGVTTATAEVGF
jgi:hypothetical protein